MQITRFVFRGFVALFSFHYESEEKKTNRLFVDSHLKCDCLSDVFYNIINF